MLAALSGFSRCFKAVITPIIEDHVSLDFIRAVRAHIYRIGAYIFDMIYTSSMISGIIKLYRLSFRTK